VSEDGDWDADNERLVPAHYSLAVLMNDSVDPTQSDETGNS